MFRYKCFILTLLPFFVVPNVAKSHAKLPDSVAKIVYGDYPLKQKVETLHTYTYKLVFLKPDSARHYIDTAMILAQKSQDSELINDIFASYGHYHFFLKNHDSALYFYKKNLAYAKKVENQHELQKAYGNISVSFDNKGCSDSAIFYANKSLQLAIQLQDTNQMAKVYSDLGGYYSSRANYYQAIDHLQKAIKYQSPQNYLANTILYLRMGLVYFNINDFEQAMQASRKALAFNRRLSNVDYSALIYNNIGHGFDALQHDTDSALFFYQKAMQSALNNEQTYSLLNLYINIGGIHFDRGDYEKALVFLEKAYENELLKDIPKSYTTTLVNLGMVHNKLGNLDKARYFTEKGLQKTRQHHLVECRKNAFLTLAEIDAAKGNFRQAAAYKDSVIKINKILFDDRLNDRIADLKVTHELEKKEAQNQVLLLKDKEKSRLIFWQSILLILLLFFMSIAVWFALRFNKQKKKFKELNQTKDKFFSIISHDLKGPVGTSSAMLDELIEEYDHFDEEERRVIIQNIHKSAQRTYHLLENLLDWSRSQRGTLKTNPELIDIGEVINEVLAYLESRIQNKNIRIENNNMEVGKKILADRRMIRTILINLINNAIKFSHKGGTIALEVREQNEQLFVSVKDDGIGIPKSIRNKLFSPDNTVQRRGTDHEQGTGLGLVLVADFVRMMKGHIEVVSEEGKGSAFTFVLPVDNKAASS
jgi:signal transduction histidine kinase